ncbi:MAG: F0F1 ATP synthase subunit B family protein [Inquilinaceae bacterium]
MADDTDSEGLVLDPTDVGGQQETVKILHAEGGPEGGEADQGIFSTELWLLLALAALIAIAFRPAKRAILGGLDNRAERIRHDLDEAQRLREEAQAALTAYQRQHRDAMTEAEEIIAHAREESERMRRTALQDLETAMERRQALALERIAQAEAAAAAEVRNAAVDVAVSAARTVIADQLDQSKANALIDAAINELPQKLN